MTRYHIADSSPCEWYATKYDECTVRATGRPYRMQEGSGRSAVITKFFQDGMKLGEISRAACADGWDPAFTVDCAFKQHGSKQNAWEVVPPEGTTIEAIKAQRKEREMSPEQKAKKAEREAEKVKKAAEREAAKTERQAEKERKAAEAKEARAREREAAKAKAEADRAAAAGSEVATPSPKAKGKKASKAAPEAEAPTAEELQQAAEA